MEDRPTILIAQRDDVDQRFLAAFLGDVGDFQFVEARSASEVIQGLGRGPDLILVDTHVPGNIMKAVELMRRMPKLNHVGIVATSAHRQFIRKCRGKGFNGMILKPYTLHSLLTKVWKVLERVPPLPGDGGPAKLQIEIDDIEGLPTLPIVYTKVQKLCEDPDVDADELAGVIEADPSVTMKLLRLVNSAFFAFGRKITSIQDAVSLLGNQTVQNAVLSISVFESTKDTGDGGGLDQKEFWRHSAACGSVVRFIARQKKIDREDAFTAGILHDIGKIVLDGLFAQFYKDVFKAVEERGISIMEAEESELSLSHASLGEELATSWGIPSELIQAISHHHRPDRADLDPQLASMVHIADAVSRNLEIGSGGDPLVPAINPCAFAQLSLDPEDLIAWEDEIRAELSRDMAFLSAIA